MLNLYSTIPTNSYLLPIPCSISIIFSAGSVSPDMKEETGEETSPTSFKTVAGAESDALLGIGVRGTQSDALLGFNPHPDYKMSSGEVLNVS